MEDMCRNTRNFKRLMSL